MNSLRRSYRLAPGWRATTLGESTLLSQGQRALQLQLGGESAAAARRLIAALCADDEPVGTEQAMSDIDQEVLDLLVESGAIWPRAESESAVTDLPFSRNIAFWQLFAGDPADAERTHARLTNAHVVLIGVGGFGSWLAYLLAGSGVGRISLIDDDTVAASNLSRQLLYTAADIGMPKVHAARGRLLASFPDLQISVFKRRIEQQDDLDGVLSCRSLVIAPIGLPSSTQGLNGVHLALLQACATHESALMFCGSGYVGPILSKPSHDGLVEFLGRESIAEILATAELPTGIGANLAQPALASRLGITSSLCAWEATRFLAGIRCYAVNRMITVDSMHYTGMRVLG